MAPLKWLTDQWCQQRWLGEGRKEGCFLLVSESVFCESLAVIQPFPNMKGTKR